MSDLQSRVDKYINHECSDPLAIGLIMELKAHLRAANKASERIQHNSWQRLYKSFDTDKRLQAIEQQLAINDVKGE